MNKKCSIYILCPLTKEIDRELAKAEYYTSEAKRIYFESLSSKDVLQTLRWRVDELRDDLAVQKRMNQDLRIKLKGLEKLLYKALKINEIP